MLHGREDLRGYEASGRHKEQFNQAVPFWRADALGHRLGDAANHGASSDHENEREQAEDQADESKTH